MCIRDRGTGTSYALHGAWEFSALNLPWMISGQFQQFQYPHNCSGPTDPQCQVTVIGDNGATAVPAFSARDSNLDGHLGIKVADPRIYVGVGYLWRNNNYGYPRLTSFGFGAEKLPDLNQDFSVYGSFYYYPNAKGAYNGLDLAYNLLNYNVGIDYVLGKSPVFLEAGWTGMSATNKSNAPSGVSANGPFVGLGIKF